MYLLYNLLITVLSPLWLPWMWLRSRARKEQPNWQERMGNYSFERLREGRRIWIHAVSVGEVVAAMPLLSALRRLLPADEIVLSVTTSSGHQTAREKATGLYDHLVYFPIDFARFQLGAMQRVQPAVVAVMETELWMNFLWAAKVFDARTLLVNGRISDRSFRRSRWVRFFYRSLLSRMDRCLMQSSVDSERILALGARSAEVLGNVKFDQAASVSGDGAEWRAKLGLGDLPVVVVGSTRGEMEEDFVLAALHEFSDVQIIHAPRHVERANALADKARPHFTSVGFRSKGETARYLILDTYGELDKVYAVADVVVIGGGFDKLGGQNIIQPLAHGKPVLHGPHMHNFRDVAAASVACGASVICSTPHELRDQLSKLLADAPARDAMGRAARELVDRNLGASERYARAIAEEASRLQ